MPQWANDRTSEPRFGRSRSRSKRSLFPKSMQKYGRTSGDSRHGGADVDGLLSMEPDAAVTAPAETLMFEHERDFMADDEDRDFMAEKKEKRRKPKREGDRPKRRTKGRDRERGSKRRDRDRDGAGDRKRKKKRTKDKRGSFVAE